MNIITKISFFSLSFLFLVGCGPKKNVVAETQPVKEREKEVVEGFRTLSMDKATISLMNVSGNKTSLSGSLRICRDSIIICSITPFAGVNMEFARIGVDKKGITIMDRINKRYFSMTYEEALTRFGMEMNYNLFESIFTDRVFIYNSPYIPLTSDFDISKFGDQILLARADDKVSQEFYYDAAKTLVSGMLSAGNQFSLRWNYSDFAECNNVSFPKRLSMKIAGPAFHRQIQVDYKAVELDRDRNFKFVVPESYTKVSLDELLKML